MSPVFSRPDHSPSRRMFGRLGIALFIVVVSVATYYSQSAVNPVTGEKQLVALTVQDEIALGLRSAPEMAAQFGGLDSNRVDQTRVKSIGSEVARAVQGEHPYGFDFHLLGDPHTVNAFALPGGQIFITRALYAALDTDGQLAGVLAHEVGHVIERHSAQQLAKARLSQGLTGAAILATADPEDPRSQNRAQLAMVVSQLISMRFSREDELESDRWGVQLTGRAGYDPRGTIRVMEILQQHGGGAPEFFSTHPNPEHRIARIQEAIADAYPTGLPAGLRP